MTMPDARAVVAVSDDQQWLIMRDLREAPDGDYAWAVFRRTAKPLGYTIFDNTGAASEDPQEVLMAYLRDLDAEFGQPGQAANGVLAKLLEGRG